MCGSDKPYFSIGLIPNIYFTFTITFFQGNKHHGDNYIGVIDDMVDQVTQSDISFYLSIQDIFIIYSISLR